MSETELARVLFLNIPSKTALTSSIMWQTVTDERGFRANAAEKVTPCVGQLKQSGNKS